MATTSPISMDASCVMAGMSLIGELKWLAGASGNDACDADEPSGWGFAFARAPDQPPLSFSAQQMKHGLQSNTPSIAVYDNFGTLDVVELPSRGPHVGKPVSGQANRYGWIAEFVARPKFE